MTPEIAYFLKINAGIAVFYLFYRAFLHKDTFFGWRRTLFLGFLAVSLFYPLLNIQEWMLEQEPMVYVADVYASVMLPEVTVGVTATPQTSWTDVAGIILGLVYAAGVLVLTARFLIQLTCILRIRWQSTPTVIQGTRVYIPRKAAEPFSFFHWIFFNPGTYNADEIDEILTHERTHAQQRHSLDVLASELMCIACWMNPFAWLLKQEIRNNLEYMADNHVLQTGHDYQSYQYHLLGLAHQKAAAKLSNSFNVLPLKKRIRMMNKKRTKEIGKTKYLMFLPLAALLLVISNIEAVARSTKNLAKEAVLLVEEGVAPDLTVQSPQKSTGDQNPKTAPAQKKAAPKPIKIEPNADGVYEMAEDMPQYPGGMAALMKFLNENIKYPQEDQNSKTQGRVIVQYVVGKDGSIGNVRILRNVSPTIDAEALRIISLMPKWEPGKVNGVAVPVKYTVPIVFRLPGEKGKSAQVAVAGVDEKGAIGIQYLPVKVVSNEENGEEPTFEVVEKMPEFPGGMEALLKFLSENIKYPATAVEQKIQGRVIVQFIVAKDGSITKPFILRGVSPELDAEALRVISIMPTWKPGTQRGQAVNVKYTVPITFSLPKTEPAKTNN